MSRLEGAHLPTLAQAFELGLREGAITVAQAREFCETTYTATLEQQVRTQPPITPRGNRDGKKDKLGSQSGA
jgi:hypothetical protein